MARRCAQLEERASLESARAGGLSSPAWKRAAAAAERSSTSARREASTQRDKACRTSQDAVAQLARLRDEKRALAQRLRAAESAKAETPASQYRLRIFYVWCFESGMCRLSVTGFGRPNVLYMKRAYTPTLASRFGTLTHKSESVTHLKRTELFPLCTKFHSVPLFFVAGGRGPSLARLGAAVRGAREARGRRAAR